MKRLLCLFLTVIMLVSVFAGCKKNDPEAPGTSGVTSDDGTPSGTNEPTTEEPKKTWDDLPRDKFDGEEYNILGREHSVWGSYDLYTTDTSTDLSAAVFARNSAVELRYGITINLHTPSGISTLLQQMDQADYSEYDLYSLQLQSWGKRVSSGYFQDLTKAKELDLTDSWYDQDFINYLTIHDQLYGVISDATYVDKYGTWATAFNTDMIAAYNLNVDMYKLVEDGEWTFAKMKELAKQVCLDVNEDGVMELGGQDIYGIGGELTNLDFFIQASGMPYAYYSDNTIVYSLTDKVSVFDDIFQTVYELVADSAPLTYMAEAQTANGKWTGARNFFEQQQMLFFVGGINNLPIYFRSFKHDYGVIPMPKYTTDQERYYNPVTAINCPVLCVPRNAENTQMSMVILQALACRGEETVQPVFYDTVLKNQASRDPQTWSMLDMIFSERVFDLATIHDFGSLAGKTSSELSNLVLEGRPGDFASTVESKKTSADDKIKKLLAFYDANYAE